MRLDDQGFSCRAVFISDVHLGTRGCQAELLLDFIKSVRCERLYLVGPFQHPGGGVFGAGRAAAIRAFGDLRLDFAKVGAR